MRSKRLLPEQPWLFDTIISGVQVKRYVCTFCGPPPGRRFFTLGGLRIHRAKAHKDLLPSQAAFPLG